MTRTFSGIQPSGHVHLGNYLGALRHWVDEQHRHECFFSIVDLHAITSPRPSAELLSDTRETAAILFAIGLEPALSTIFVQSHVHEHAELCWILNCLTGLGELRRMTQFKDKAFRGREIQSNAGLLVYPVLQAADILLYQAERVLVGDDQRQHLELARTLARRFNGRFGRLFCLPEAVIPRAGARIMDLQDPKQKMSKSARSASGSIYLTDSAEVIQQKIRTAVTDSGRGIVASPDRPAITNLITIYSALTGMTVGKVQESFAGSGYEQFKRALTEVLIEALRPVRERYRQWLDSRDEMLRYLRNGAEHATSVASLTINLAFQRVGFLR